MLKNYKYLCLLYVGALVVNACSDSVSSTESDTPPTLPNAESMAMDLAAFDQEVTLQDEVSNTEYSNFNNAVSRASLLKVVVNWNLGLPRKIFEAAINTEPKRNEQDEWEWIYNRSANGERYDVRLAGTRQNGNTIQWECYVTSSNLNLQDVLIFEGISNTEGTEGTWTYFDILTPDDQSPVTKTTWARQGDNASLMLEVLPGESNFAGDIIEYTSNDTIKEAFFYNADINETTELQWNTATFTGYLITTKYNNGEKACWGSNLRNTACAE